MAENLVQHLLSQLPMPLSLISKQLTAVATGVFQATLPLIYAVSGGSATGEKRSGISPELLNAALLLFILWMSLQIVRLASLMMYRMVKNMIKLSLFVVFAVVGLSVMNRGLKVTQQDMWQFFETVARNKALYEHWDKYQAQAGYLKQQDGIAY